jgi:hypothetical protein
MQGVTAQAPAGGAAPARAEHSPLDWIRDHVGTFASTVATIGLVAAVPLTREHVPGAAAKGLGKLLAGQLERTSVGSAAVSIARRGALQLRTSAAQIPGAGAAGRGWNAMRDARMSLGDTRVGQALLTSQRPLYFAGGAAGAVMLGEDVQNWRNGHGSVHMTALHVLGLVPLAGDLGKRVAAASAASTEARAATRAVKELAHAEGSTAAALRLAQRTDAPEGVSSIIKDAKGAIGATTDEVAASADHVAGRARITGPAPSIPTSASDRTYAVNDLRAQVTGAEERMLQARLVSRRSDSTPAVVGDRLEQAVVRAQRAADVLGTAGRRAARLTIAARSAQELELATAQSGVAAGVATNSVAVHRAGEQAGDEQKRHASIVALGRSLLSEIFTRNGAAAPAGAVH